MLICSKLHSKSFDYLYKQNILLLLIKQVVNAQNWNAKGLLLYVDPADYVSQDTIRKQSKIIQWYPSNEVQSEGLRVNRGDPFTPGYPATSESASVWTGGTSTH